MSDTTSNQTHIWIRDLLAAGARGQAHGVVMSGELRPTDVLTVAIGMLREEQAAHHQTRTALDHTTLILARIALRLRTYAPGLGLIIVADEQIVENQRVLGLAVAEADKPHDGNER